MFETGKLKLRLQQNVCAAVVLMTASSVQAAPIISEVLYDAASSDNGNVFVELFGTPGTVLDGLVLEGVNGSDGSEDALAYGNYHAYGSSYGATH